MKSVINFNRMRAGAMALSMALLFAGALSAHAQSFYPGYGGSAGYGNQYGQGGGGACLFVYAPVCGVNGRTYSNDCFARMAGVPVLHQGACNVDSGYPPAQPPYSSPIPFYGYFNGYGQPASGSSSAFQFNGNLMGFLGFNPAMNTGSYGNPWDMYGSNGGSWGSPYGSASAYGSQYGNSWMQFFQRPFGINLTQWSS